MADDVDFSKTTESIVTDFISHSLRSQGYQWGDPSSIRDDSQAKTIRQLSEMADDFANRYESTFTSMIDNLHVTSDTAYSTFKSVTEELFAEGISWGRVLALFHFGRTLVMNLAEAGELHPTESLVKKISHFIEGYLKSWILQRGGWMQCIDHFSKELLQIVLPAYKRMIRLLRTMVLLLSILLNTSLGARPRLKHGVGTTANVAKLILWVCGDVELNPGPGNSRSEILRRFRKSQQSSILIMLYEHLNDQCSVPKSLYKDVPAWWPKDTPFVNISNHKKEEDKCIACFDMSVELLKSAVSGISPDLTNILGHYKDLLNKCGDNAYLEMCKDKLLDWMGSKKIQKALQTVDTKSFMDDLRLKLKVLEDLANQGETIPDDIADRVSAVNLSINSSKRKRRRESVKDSCPKRQKSGDQNGSSDATSKNVPIMKRFCRSPKHVAEQSNTSGIDDEQSLGHTAYSNDCSITFASANQTLDNIEVPGNDATNCAAGSSRMNTYGFEIDDATSTTSQLPSDFLNIILNETNANDVIANFDLNLFEL
ncbi:hypothetical protein FSP39_021696 [Pinctada imbricata]|uniref:Apoptosis regulator Bcl-2 family BH4 domain-containing protein n=1 Tax=Pinctada imbricata TaxID=66713 RepID=A0AA88YEK4_PINIB|nr:hypothetical protein FSP39_021696 [Pinctada imbricata]